MPEELARGLAAVTLAGRRLDRDRWSPRRSSLFAAHRPPPLRDAARRARRTLLRWPARWLGSLFFAARLGGDRRALRAAARRRLRALFGLLLAAGAW